MSSLARFLQTDQPTVGYCTSGVATGAYVAFFPLGDGAESSGTRGSVRWDGRFSIPVGAEGLLPGDVFEVEESDPSVWTLLESLSIQWIPEPIASRVLFSLFPASELDDSADHVAVTGRFSRGAVLTARLAELERRGRLDGEFATAVPGGIPAVLEAVRSIEGSLDAIATLLLAADLAIAVVPARGRVALGSPGEPWLEFED